MAAEFDALLGRLRIKDSGAGGSGGEDSTVASGTVDGTSTAALPMFYNTTQQSLKIYVGGFWITIATVSFDSLWDSITDNWDSVQMDWDSPS